MPGELTALGWRAVVLALIALLVVYALIAWLRLKRVARPRSAQVDAPSGVDAPPATSASTVIETSAFSGDERRRLVELEADHARLREEINALRAAMKAMREDFETRSEAMSNHLQATQHVSPIYGDAMQMALAGEAVETISERCGIARAEAELVVALVHRRDGEPQGDEGNDGEQSRY